ncbi:unnamed protein product [Camellia sinensis]
MAEHSDLDQLLDSALDDFQNLNLTSSIQAQRSGDGEVKKHESCIMPSSEVQGLGMGLPDLRSKKKGKQKVSKESHVSEALDKLREQTREAVKGLESVTGSKPLADDFGKDPMMEDWVKQFEELAGSQEEGGKTRWQLLVTVSALCDRGWVYLLQRFPLNVQNLYESFTFSGLKILADVAHYLSIEYNCRMICDDMESIVETMMQQLLSKEILHEPMKEIGERYPKWLEEHKSNLGKDDYDRYSHQYKLIKDLLVVYETEPSNFNKIVELMQKMQECGQPPNDIVQELAPDFDLSNLGQLSPEMLESQQNCCVM